MLNRFLEGVPPPEWTRRARAKDELRKAARDLRAQGLDYEDIAAALSVAKSSVSLWVRDLPTPPRLSYEENRKRSAEGARRYWEVERTVREAGRAAVTERATDEIGAMTDREILIAGAVAYWCEGTKSKPHRRVERVAFINSDPALIGFFLRFLDTAGIPLDDLIFRVYIHESADVERLTGSGWISRQLSPASSGGRYSSATTRRLCARTLTRVTVAACGSTSAGAATCTARSRAGLRLPWWAVLSTGSARPVFWFE